MITTRFGSQVEIIAYIGQDEGKTAFDQPFQGEWVTIRFLDTAKERDVEMNDLRETEHGEIAAAIAQVKDISIGSRLVRRSKAMAADIYEQKFYTYKIPAWHRIVEPSQEPLTAMEAAERMGGLYQVYSIPLSFKYGRKAFSSKYAHIVREPLEVGGDPIVLGQPVMDGQYVVVSPNDTVDMWMRNVLDEKNRPVRVETMGLLGKYGQRMFITTGLPSFDVKGDEINNYLLLFNPIIPGKSLKIVTTSVRVVCQNTLMWGLQQATQTITVPRTNGARERVEAALGNIYGNSVAALSLIKEAAEHLAKARVTSAQVRTVAETVYRLPQRPDAAKLFKTAYDERMASYEREVTWTNQVRDLAVELFDGRGIGLDSPEVAGTAWAGWQAFAEIETYRKGQAEAIFRKLVEGDRGRAIRRAYSEFMGLAGIPVEAAKPRRAPRRAKATV